MSAELYNKVQPILNKIGWPYDLSIYHYLDGSFYFQNDYGISAIGDRLHDYMAQHIICGHFSVWLDENSKVEQWSIRYFSTTRLYLAEIILLKNNRWTNLFLECDTRLDALLWLVQECLK